MTFKTAGLKLASLALAGLLLARTAARADTVVNRGNGAEPETLDPQKLTGVPEANIAYDLYEGLATLDDHGNPTGGVAKSWDVSDDGKVYTFHLRDDAKWSNGDPITADDVVYSLRRIVDPKVAAEYAYIYAPILNADDINSGKEKDLTKLGVDAVDPAYRQDHAEGTDALSASAFSPIPPRRSSTRRPSRSSAINGRGRATTSRSGAYTSPNGSRSRASCWSRTRISMTRRM